jgi:hypothetical protein
MGKSYFRVIWGIVFSGMWFGASAAVVDTINGVVTDSMTTLKLDQVTVSSEGQSTLTKSDGTYQLFLAATGAIQSQRSYQAPAFTWHPENGLFSRSGYLGPVFIRFLDIRGDVATQYDSRTAVNGNMFSIVNLPQGVFVATVSTREGVDAYKILSIASGGTRFFSTVSHRGNNVFSKLSKAMSTSTSHVLAFSRSSYTTKTMTVSAAGINSNVGVKLSPAPGAVVKLFNGKTLDGWFPSPNNNWTVNLADSAIEGTGAARGWIATLGKYKSYRVIYSVRQISGDHMACILFDCCDPTSSQALADPNACGGVQFQLPYGGWYDYHNGLNCSCPQYFTSLVLGGFNYNQWAQCEVLVNGDSGSARAACAQPVGSKAIEMVRFHDATTVGFTGPFALQCHNGGIFDEYKNITIEVNPIVKDLITTK